MLMWYTWFGVMIDFNTGGVDMNDAANVELWETIGGIYTHSFAPYTTYSAPLLNRG